jgi:hypothetical protein
MKRFALLSCFGFLALGTASAQEFSKFTADIGAGFTMPVGTAGRNLDPGWNVNGGVGYNFSAHLGAKVNLGFDSMGINSITLTTVGAPGGDVHIFQATLDPVLHFAPRGRFNFYVTGGGGVFHRYQEFTQPTVVTGSVFNPFFGFYPVAFGATQVLASYTVTKPGFDVGAGVEIGGLRHTKFFAESKWNHMFLNGGHTDFIPVGFGVRW